jgi:hypothetical protein
LKEVHGYLRLGAVPAGTPADGALIPTPTPLSNRQCGDELRLLRGRVMIWFYQNKVALTILMGLALIGLFAVTQSGVAILAISRFGASFNQIAETNLLP